ncbi:MAG: riboflavin biosynthesis protein RibF, partial [Mucispirillum sp.]|nr:riboflavin biosynthesis protein RibF [Mucispirillum sp.]
LIIVGKEYKFGKNQSGNTDTLYELGKKYGTDCVFLDKLKDGNGIDISSSRIRELIKTGNPAKVACFLNEPYSLEGIVIHGDKLGRELGFPTINIKTVNEVIPLNGVYAAKVKINGILYGAMAYIGNRPAIAEKTELRIEANIFDFNSDVYGADAEIFFYEYIRGDMKFASLNDLINNMKGDKNKAVKILGNL